MPKKVMFKRDTSGKSVTSSKEQPAPSTSLSLLESLKARMMTDTSSISTVAAMSSEAKAAVLDEIQSDVLPVYLRDAATYRLYARLTEERELDNMIKDKDAPPPPPPQPKWPVQQPDLNQWRQNRIDHRTIYGLGDLVLPAKAKHAAVVMKKSEASTRKPDSELEREKTYIMSIRRVVRSPEAAASQRFLAKTMSSFNRPKPPGERDNPYCSPRNTLLLDDSQVKKKPQMEKVTRMPSSVQRYTRQITRGGGGAGMASCRHSTPFHQQFCDVLGPAVCGTCIEEANKKIADEVQKSSFPSMDFSVTTIVAPKLASILVKRPSKERRRSSIQLPSLPPPASRDFQRAGIENKWLERSRTFMSQKTALTSQSNADSVDSDLLAMQYTRSRSNTKCSIKLPGGS